ncbi:hypothetical protein BCR42DRAFT_454801 [Absidia repens]|uniref:Histidine kinase n=1 Tax=Absidia repens TaxID=90262 RepID=A0A1X2I5F1_9FUNG|nr:hypothetical protein BCR42DRAFT_454801 [Absidia repens]
MEVTGPPLRKSQQQPQHGIASTTTQYHAQLYSEQKRLQNQLLQQTMLPSSNPSSSTTHANTAAKVKKDNETMVHISLPTLTFETPNLYRTSLKLSKEINIHSWWTTVVGLLTDDSFRASRVTLCVPQDSSDPFSGPWGLKAVYDNNSNNLTTTDNDIDINGHQQDPTIALDHKGSTSFSPASSSKNPRLKCFERLQSLDSDPVPLINNSSIQQILRRNDIVVLSREYRSQSSRLLYKKPTDENQDMVKRALLEKRSSFRQPANTKTTSLDQRKMTNDSSKNGIHNDHHHHHHHHHHPYPHPHPHGPLQSALMTDYDDYEQQQPSPWSHSPAPSPALMDPDVNPFFQSIPDIDDDAFNPEASEPTCTTSTSIPFPPPATNAHSVVHIPIVHPADPDLDDDNEDSNPFKTASSSADKSKHYSTPIAILSFLSPVVPYPAVLLQWLRSVQAFIATSLSNALAYSRMIQAKFNTDASVASGSRGGSVCGRTPLLRRHSHKIKRWPSQTFSGSSAFSNGVSSASSSSSLKRKSSQNSALQMEKNTKIDGKLQQPSPSSPTNQQLPIDNNIGTSAASSHLKMPLPMPSFSSHGESSTTNSNNISPLVTIDSNNEQHSQQHPSNSTKIVTTEDTHHGSNNSPVKVTRQKQNEYEQNYTDRAPSPSMHPSAGTMPSAALNSSSRYLSDDVDDDQHPASSSNKNSTTNNNKKSASPKDSKKQHGIKKRRNINTTNFMRSPRQRPLSAPADQKRHIPMRHTRSRESIDKYLHSPGSSLLRLVIDGIPIHVFTCSTKTGQITWVNNRILQYTGRALQDHLGPGWLSHMHPDDQTDFRQAWEQAFEQGNGFAGEYRLRRFDGVYRGFLWRIVPLRDIKGIIIHWFGTCTDVHDQQLAKENSLRQMEIESNERKYRLLADAIPQIVFTFSPGVGLTYANGKWENYSNQPFERTKGFGFISQVHQDDRHKLQLPDLSPHKTAGVTWHTEIRLLGGDGSYRWFLVKSISVDELDTGEVRWFGTCTDINDQKLLEHKLKEAHDAAQKSTESKSRFLSNMSHEMRTPLIGITGMLNFLLDTELTAEQLDYAHTIQQSAESLLVVINDILDHQRVEAGMMKLAVEPFSIVTMIEDANELLSTLAIQKGLELSFWVDDDVPAVVKGDRVRLRQVLLNLIGNAIKFTTHGEVYTRCKIQHINVQQSELMLLFEVVDTGTGFDADGEAVMFKPFSQVDSSSTRKHGGSGLGLVISRQLIELHGGEMKCSGKKGEGSTFSFTAKFEIPVANTKPQPQTPQNENVDPFFRTDAYKVVHDQTYRQELEQQQQQQILKQSNTSSSMTDKSEPIAFSPSPLAHSKKHSQTNEIPPSNDLFQNVLINKPVNMKLMSPPKRKQPSGQTSLSSSSSSSTLQKELSISPISPSPPTIVVKKDTPETSPLISSYNSPMLTRDSSSASFPSHDLLSTSTAVILPPRTPTRLAPLRTLIVCEWKYSRDTMERHVRRIVDELSNSQQQHLILDIAADVSKAQSLLSDPASGSYDYVLVNLRAEQQILALTSSICDSTRHHRANIMIVTTPMQRSLLMEYAASGYYGDKNVIPRSCGFVFKPLKRSKLNWYFGIRGDSNNTQNQYLSTNNNSENGFYPAQEPSHRSATTQKEVFRKMEADVGGKGFRILLVEDNLVNQKVLTRYLVRVGLLVDVANDGEECTKYFMTKPYGYYSLILCDLFMPVKDGYEATREIRAWEEKHLDSNQRRIPIVALSANVMSNVATKCLECGFSTYISKPVNFAILSDVIRSYLLPERLLHIN